MKRLADACSSGGVTTLICYHGHNSKPSEFAGLKSQRLFGTDKKVVVLTSPTRKNMRQIYKDVDAHPVHFKWEDLTIAQIRTLMKAGEKDEYLNLSAMAAAMRKYGKPADFDRFALFCEGLPLRENQLTSLKQRLFILKEFLTKQDESKSIREVIAEHGEGTIVILDLSDPLCSTQDLNALFQVALEQFLGVSHHKLVLFDEAHKYLTRDWSEDGLNKAILQANRLRRHHHLRVAISTQNPEALPPELMDIANLVFVMRLHSPTWFQFLMKRIPLQSDQFQQCTTFSPGHGLAYISQEGLITKGDQPVPLGTFLHFEIKHKAEEDEEHGQGHDDDGCDDDDDEEEEEEDGEDADDAEEEEDAKQPQQRKGQKQPQRKKGQKQQPNKRPQQQKKKRLKNKQKKKKK